MQLNGLCIDGWSECELPTLDSSPPPCSPNQVHNCLLVPFLKYSQHLIFNISYSFTSSFSISIFLVFSEFKLSYFCSLNMSFPVYLKSGDEVKVNGIFNLSSISLFKDHISPIFYKTMFIAHPIGIPEMALRTQWPE